MLRFLCLSIKIFHRFYCKAFHAFQGLQHKIELSKTFVQIRWRNFHIETEKSEQTVFAQISLSEC